LLFVKTEVIERPLCKGKRLIDERKRRLRDELNSSKKRRKLEVGVRVVGGVLGVLAALDNEDKELKLELCLIYNSVQGYVSAIIEL
jgi:hypothetical protein